MRVNPLSMVLVVSSLLFSACTTGGPGETGTGGQTGTAGNGTGTGNGDGTGGGTGTGTGGGTNATNVAIPDIFYDGWAYETATLYEEGKDPIIASVGGDASFERDMTYKQDYGIGGIGNHYAGRYTVDGPDPRMEGAFMITTYDDEGSEAFQFSVACGQTEAMALTIYGDDGKPSIIYGLRTTRR